MDENNSNPPPTTTPQGEAKPGLLKRTSTLFGLLGSNAPAAAEAPKTETIAEEPEEAVAAVQEAVPEPAAEAVAEQVPAAEAVVEEATAVVTETAEQVIETEAPVEAEAPVVAEEPAPVEAEAEAVPAATEEPDVPEAVPAAVDEPEAPVEAAVPVGEAAAPEVAEEAAPVDNQVESLQEALQEEPPAEDKKVTFDDKPEEIPAPAEPEPPTAPVEKKKSFLGGLFSRKKEEEPAPAPEPVPEEGHGGEAAAAAGVAAVAAAGGAAAVAASSPEEATPAAPVETPVEQPAATEAPAEAPAATEEAAPAEGGVEPVHVGVLYKPGLYVKSHIKERHFRLMPDGLLQYSRKDTFKRTKNIQLVHEATVDTEDVENEKEAHRYRLCIHMPANRVYCLRCDAPEERDAWVSDIQRICETLEAAAPAADSAQAPAEDQPASAA